jgi:hypothetical protein
MLIVYMITISPTNLLGLLCVRAKAKRIPPLTWALEIGIETLETATLQRKSSLGMACARIPKGRTGIGGRRQGVDRLMRGLVRAGCLRPIDAGWDAGYEAEPGWIEQHRDILKQLSPGDREALRVASQRFRAALTTWSKKAVASEPSGAATDWSRTNPSAGNDLLHGGQRSAPFTSFSGKHSELTVLPGRTRTVADAYVSSLFANWLPITTGAIAIASLIAAAVG